MVIHNGECWECLRCGKTAKKKYQIKVHAETHVEGMENICQFCGRNFKTSGSLQNHVSLKHRNPINI